MRALTLRRAGYSTGPLPCQCRYDRAFRVIACRHMLAELRVSAFWCRTMPPGTRWFAPDLLRHVFEVSL
jgi:hypothetical protein